MSNDTDLQTDEDIVQGATREELLTTGALGKGRTFRSMTLRPPTMESMSYLWEMKNYFVFRDEQGRIVRNNPVLGVAEFFYVHHADIDEVAETMTNKKALRESLRGYINGPLAGLATLEEAVPVIEAMLNEYMAAQSEIEATAGGKGVLPGKGQARAGKRRISR
jgi:hypothetical protein